MDEQLSRIDDLIVKHLAGEADETEEQELRRWTAASTENAARLRRRRELWASASTAERLRRFDSDRAFAAFNERRRHAEDKPKARLVRLFRYAATACVLLAVAVYTSFNAGRQRVTAAFADIVVEAPAGSNTVATLPDGTRVTLNAGSRLVYSQGYGVQNRRVRLSGEGYFDVKKHKTLPFSIETASLVVEDIGTKFNLSDYADDNIALLQLDEGIVAMQDKEGRLPRRTLSPSQTALFNKADCRLTVKQSGGKPSHEWAEGRLVFSGESFAGVKKVLERAYDVDITVADKSLYGLRFHGEFSRRTDNIESVLGTFAKTGKLKYRVNGRNITIY